MGVEPTAAGSAPPASGFEDRGIHRDTFPPICYCSQICTIGQTVVADAQPLLGGWFACCPGLRYNLYSFSWLSKMIQLLRPSASVLERIPAQL